MSTATTTAPAKTTAEIITSAWALYRRFQGLHLPADGGPDLINAGALLLRLVEPHTRTWGKPGTEPDVDAIEDAADALVAAVEWHCGDEAAARVAGDKGEQR